MTPVPDFESERTKRSVIGAIGVVPSQGDVIRRRLGRLYIDAAPLRLQIEGRVVRTSGL